MGMKATTLADAITVFNPREPLVGKELVEFYVDRPGNPLERMKIYLQGIGLRGEPVKLLFSGHRGSGKSTELNKLAEALKNQFFIVSVNLSKIVNVSTLTYQDILMGMALALYRRAEESDAVARSPAEAIHNVWKEAVSFLRDKIYGPAFALRPPASPEEVTLKVSIWVTELETKYGLSADARQKLAKYIDAHFDELHAKMDLIASLVWSEIKRPVLFIIEGTDKTDIARAKEIFRDHTYALTAFRAAVIYTFPIELAYSGDFKQLTISFNRHFSLPNLRLTHRDSAPDVEGVAHQREIVECRLAAHLIEPDALVLLVQACGGVVLLLIRMTQSAAVYALSRGANKIEIEDIRSAIAEERSDFIRMLKPEQYPVLAERHNDKTLSSQPEVQELLHNLSLLEYANDDPWCDVHPVILPVVQERTR